jgi:hypothetical protein
MRSFDLLHFVSDVSRIVTASEAVDLFLIQVGKEIFHFGFELSDVCQVVIPERSTPCPPPETSNLLIYIQIVCLCTVVPIEGSTE